MRRTATISWISCFIFDGEKNKRPKRPSGKSVFPVWAEKYLCAARSHLFHPMDFHEENGVVLYWNTIEIIILKGTGMKRQKKIATTTTATNYVCVCMIRRKSSGPLCYMAVPKTETSENLPKCFSHVNDGVWRCTAHLCFIFGLEKNKHLFSFFHLLILSLIRIFFPSCFLLLLLFWKYKWPNYHDDATCPKFG